MPLIVWVYIHSDFRGGLRKRMHYEAECVMAVQFHSRSLILVGYQPKARMQLAISRR